MQQLLFKKLSYCNNSTGHCFFEVNRHGAFFLLEGLIAVALTAVMAGVLSVLITHAAVYATRGRLLHGALNVACCALDAVVYGGAPLSSWQQGDYAIITERMPMHYTPDAVSVQVSWRFHDQQEHIELISVRRTL